MSRRILTSEQCRWMAGSHFAAVGVLLLMAIFERLTLEQAATAGLLGAANGALGLYWKGQI
jgi:hypothetical protein